MCGSVSKVCGGGQGKAAHVLVRWDASCSDFGVERATRLVDNRAFCRTEGRPRE